MSGSNYDVDADQLRAHAGALAGYADRLATIGTGLPGSVADQSLGSFNSFLTKGLGGAMTETLTAFGHAASTVDMVSTGIRQAADTYERTDDAQASQLTGIDPSAGEGGR